jgi:hypothetical protein
MAAEILRGILQNIYQMDWITAIPSSLLLLTSSLALRIYFRYKSNPHRPLITALLDSCCEPFQFLRVGPWARPCDMRTALDSVLRSKQLASIQDLQLFTGDTANGRVGGNGIQNLGEFVERYPRNRQVTLQHFSEHIIHSSHTNQSIKLIRLDCRRVREGSVRPLTPSCRAYSQTRYCSDR